MNITFTPQLRDDITLASLSKAGDVLTINGTAYDFSVIPNGQVAYSDAFAGEMVVHASRDFSGDLSVVVLLPYPTPIVAKGKQEQEPTPTPQAVLFPEWVNNAPDGEIGVPGA